MVRTLLTAALTAGLLIGTASAAYADDVCVCVTVYGSGINEKSTGYQCQPTAYSTWERDVTLGSETIVVVRVDVIIPTGNTP